MKVKIVTASESKWYFKLIGNTYDLINETSCGYLIPEINGCNYLAKSDCELIQDPVKIPFTFAAWDKDRSQKVWTRDGREVKQLTYFEVGKEPLYGVVENYVRCWTKEGFYYVEKDESSSDLFLEHTEKEYWVNIYTNKDGIKFGTVYDSEQEAKDAFVITEDKYLKTISFKA